MILSPQYLQLALVLLGCMATLSVGNPVNNVTHPRALPVINHWAALGDSYSAGPGAGDVIDDGSPKCYRCTQSYPSQLNNNTGMIGAPRTFEFVGCSGARTPDIQQQILKVSPDVQIATLTIGGNNVGFFRVLNACIYRFYGARSGDCQTEINQANTHLASQDFPKEVTDAITTIMTKVPSTGFRLYVTGYAQFFNAATDQCDQASLGFWRLSQPLLTKALRAQINTAVQALNVALKAIVDTYFKGDPRVVFIDYDPDMETHRWCEEGTIEPMPNNPNNWIFDNIFRDPKQLIANNIDATTCEKGLVSESAWDKLINCYIALAIRDVATSGIAAPDGSTPIAPRLVGDGSGDPFGVGAARTFHLKPDGYKAVQNRILNAINNVAPAR
ncbi:hypothetical protein GP486_003914 [Trichoglossum hirsutum]|uniref:SGNH hydrolase-type esterase domain-containing protein n=1 Tax=Trichoglossum hirsutum TaxID=265104 RepID=A0A9P8RQI5_9PEZI|nr:hypothetical protein GP486_003914 [Trichoglossum hirsutum]